MNDKAISKTLSYLLRHHPEEFGVTYDEFGFMNVNQVIEGICNNCSYSITREDLDRIVTTDAKGRYEYSSDGTKIRALQGHSIPIDLGLTPKEPPVVLYHGTATRFLNSIQSEGIKPMSRVFVHLSDNIHKAKEVGARHGKPIVLQIDAKRMYDDGCIFYKTNNNYWLTSNVPAEYFKCLDV